MMGSAKAESSTALTQDVLHAFDNLNGPQPGFRPVHAKGILLSGRFTPAPAAAQLTRAPHLEQASTAITVRFSDFAGIPNVPDNDPNASPRGFAVRFHLGEHVHTDIIAHSVDGFPVRTAEEFLEFLRAVAASGPDAPKPTPIEAFLGAHPAALDFVQTPKPLPLSFAADTYFGVNAYRFVSQNGVARYGRYRIRPAAAGMYLDSADAVRASPNFLFDEIADRIAKGGTRMRIMVQLAADDDVVNDATVHWPKDRPEIDFGTIEMTGILPENETEQQHIIFDPLPRVDGIEPSDDPLLNVRADIYLASGRRRRSQARTA
jgi:catalase